MFTAEQITSIDTALTTAINNVLSMFVQLLPIVAILSGVAFGVVLIYGLFNNLRHSYNLWQNERQHRKHVRDVGRAARGF